MFKVYRLTIATEHRLHDIARPQDTPICLPIRRRNLQHEQRNRQPEQDIEAMKRTIHRREILAIESREASREDHVGKLPRASLRRRIPRAVLQELLQALVVVVQHDVHPGVIAEDARATGFGRDGRRWSSTDDGFGDGRADGLVVVFLAGGLGAGARAAGAVEGHARGAEGLAERSGLASGRGLAEVERAFVGPGRGAFGADDAW